MGGYLIFRDELFAWKLKLQESNQTYHFRTEITPLKATERVTRLVFVFHEIGFVADHDKNHRDSSPSEAVFGLAGLRLIPTTHSLPRSTILAASPIYYNKFMRLALLRWNSRWRLTPIAIDLSNSVPSIVRPQPMFT